MDRTIARLLVLLPLVSACAVDAPPDAGPIQEQTGVAEEEIVGGYDAPAWAYKRAVDTLECTGTLIGPRHVLTAAHCLDEPGDEVRGYYLTPITSNYVQPEFIRLVHIRPGVVPLPMNQGDYWDDEGHYADIAVLFLSGEFEFATKPAVMRWTFPDTVINAFQVGCGRHEDEENGSGWLLARETVTIDDDDGPDGRFRTLLHTTNHGDSGGPLYDTKYNIVGALHGTDADENNLYTSVPDHLPWILGVMNWRWPHGAIGANVQRYGTEVPNSTFTAETIQVCEYACSNTAACRAFNYSAITDQCVMLATVTAVQMQPPALQRSSASK